MSINITEARELFERTIFDTIERQAKEIERLKAEFCAVIALVDTELSNAYEVRRKVFKRVESGDSHDCNLHLADGVIEGLESALRLIKSREQKGGA